MFIYTLALLEDSLRTLPFRSHGLPALSYVSMAAARACKARPAGWSWRARSPGGCTHAFIDRSRRARARRRQQQQLACDGRVQRARSGSDSELLPSSVPRAERARTYAARDSVLLLDLRRLTSVRKAQHQLAACLLLFRLGLCFLAGQGERIPT